MDDPHLLELSQFQYPSVAIEELLKEPYISYLELYKEMYREFKFYRGFIRPNPIDRAQIYRAIDLSCKDNILMKDFMIFNTNDGLIIKYRDNADLVTLTQKFDYYMAQGNNYIFVPKNCDKLDRYNYSYYRRMLNSFISNEQISGKALRMNENDNILLFLSFISSIEDVKERWEQYLQGGVLRKFKVSSDKLCFAFKVFSWTFRATFEILSDNFIEMTVKSPSIKDFKSNCDKINQSDPIYLDYVDLDFIILDQYWAFGILRILREKINDVSQIIPIVGTTRIYYPPQNIDICDIINKYEIIDPLDTGSEIFTQDEFSNMSKYRQASLIKAPSQNFYSFLDLYRNLNKADPCTGEIFPEDFVQEMNSIMNRIKGTFTSEFPPLNFKPELVTLSSESNSPIPNISFYIKFGEEVHPFWIIPDLRNTEYEKLTLDAIHILVIKWTDNSLFKGSFLPGQDFDIHLLFSPIALYVFEQTISNLNLKIYPRDIKEQSDNLREQVYILSRCS